MQEESSVGPGAGTRRGEAGGGAPGTGPGGPAGTPAQGDAAGEAPRWRTILVSRLGWRVVLVVFFSILVIETLILLPSTHNYERDLLKRVEDTGFAALKTAIMLNEGKGGHEALDAARLIAGASTAEGPAGNPPIRGAALYRIDGSLIGTFGEAPALGPEAAGGEGGLRSPDGTRYDVVWPAARTGLMCTVVGRLDVSWVRGELWKFIARIGGLVLVISVFVTGGTFLALVWLVLNPVFAMHRALVGAREDPVHSDRLMLAPRRNDELGAMAEALNALLAQVSATHREELATLSALVQQAGDGIVVYDAAGELLYANQACLKLCRCATVEEMRDGGHPRITDAPEAGTALAARSLVRGGAALEGYVVPRTGAPVAVLVRGGRLEDDEGHVLRHFAIVSDISAIRAAHEALSQRNDDLAAANKAKSNFLANMSHELRTPLNAIIGFAEIMKDAIHGPIGNPRYHDYADSIHLSGRHLLSVINDILDLAKIESGNVTLELERVDLAEAARDALHMMRQQLADAGLEVETAGLDRACPVNGDARSLKQIVLNLLSNAVKFTDPGGRVAVELAPDGAGCVALTMRDTGCGIPAEELGRVTQPFFQVEGQFARRYQGSGLGLALVSSLVELHGGALEMQSTVGEGTTVTVRFPVPAPPEALRASG